MAPDGRVSRLPCGRGLLGGLLLGLLILEVDDKEDLFAVDAVDFK